MAKRKRKKSWSVGPTKLITDPEMMALRSYLDHRRGTATGARQRLIGYLLAATGLRAAEVAGLKLRDLPGYHGAACLQVTGKGSKPRTVPISDTLAGEIDDYCRHWRVATLPRNQRAHDSRGYLLYSVWRRPYAPDGILHMVRRWGRRAGIVKRITPHMFRHTFATRSVSRVDLSTLQGLLGHSDVTITQIYLHTNQLAAGDMGRRIDPWSETQIR